MIIFASVFRLIQDLKMVALYHFTFSICTSFHCNNKQFSPQGCSLLLTDGWYSMRCVIDATLDGLIQQGRVRVGDKLCVFGAELVGNPEPAPPLQVFNEWFVGLFFHILWCISLRILIFLLLRTGAARCDDENKRQQHEKSAMGHEVRLP